MKRRFQMIPAALLLTLVPLAAPLQACCDDFWSCVGAVASGGLTCAIESLINLVRTIIDNIGRLISTLAQQTADVVNLARTELAGAVSDVRGLVNQAENDFNATVRLAGSIVEEASRPQAVAVRPPLAPAGVAAGSRALPPSGATSAAGRATSGTGVASALPPGGGAQAATAGKTTSSATAILNLPCDDREMLDTLRRAKQAIDALSPNVSTPINQIRQFATQAERQVASAAGSAVGIAESALLAPLRALGTMLGELITHPARLFDPGRLVEDATNQVTTQVIATMTQVHDLVMGQAKATLDQAQQPLHDVLDRASVAKKITDAMQKLQRAKTKHACDALDALIPRQPLDAKAMVSHVAGFTHASGIAAINLDQHRTQVAAPFNRFAASRLSARTVGTQAGAKLKAPWQDFKRLQAAPIKVDPSAKVKMDTEIERRFVGKSASEVAAEKRAILAEARTRFAKDPELLRKVEALFEAHPSIKGRGTAINPSGPRQIIGPSD